MNTFMDFKEAVNTQFSMMSQGNLFVTDVSKDELWDMYLKSFPEGTNPIFRERTKHDCQCCKTFIRGAGNVVSIHSIDNEYYLSSIWDIEIGGHYQVVADALSEMVKSKAIKGVFRYFQKNIGIDHNHEIHEDNSIKKWNHFHFKLPNKFVHSGVGNPEVQSKEEKELLERGLNEITLESIETVLELIEQKSVYRGEEYKKAIEYFRNIMVEFDDLNFSSEECKNNYLWKLSSKIGRKGRIKNTVIGTLLVDISQDMELDQAVYRFNHKMDPNRFKRPTAVISKSMIKKAEEKVKELGYIDSLSRRHAEVDDITVDNVLFINRDTKKEMSIFDEISAETPTKIKKLKKVEEVSVDTFVSDILPKANDIQVYFDNFHENNLMTLVAPSDKDAKNMLKWGNNFSWTYKGEVADSNMKDLVKKAGGNVNGVLRYTIKWNDGDNNQNDFDAHCIEPDKNLIYYGNKGIVHRSSGMLDVDIIHPGLEPAVENIIYVDKRRMKEGNYQFLVNNFSHNGGRTGFTAEIEFDGKIHTFEYNKNLREKEKVDVATVNLDKYGNFKIIKSLDSKMATKTLWNIQTNNFHKVKMIMNSPNHWDGMNIGNRHLFFILENCLNDEPVRGFFNEFLNENLTEHRKVFEVLGHKMRAEFSPQQLSGLGFSSTKKASIICKVSGSFNRTLKINF